MTAPRPFAEIVEELTRLDAAAMPGPWEQRIAGIEGDNYVAGTGPWYRVSYRESKSMDDAALIAAMRNALPLLLSRLASREAVFEAAVALDKQRLANSLSTPESSYLMEIKLGLALRAAIDAARALDAATPQGEER